MIISCVRTQPTKRLVQVLVSLSNDWKAITAERERAPEYSDDDSLNERQVARIVVLIATFSWVENQRFQDNLLQDRYCFGWSDKYRPPPHHHFGFQSNMRNSIQRRSRYVLLMTSIKRKMSCFSNLLHSSSEETQNRKFRNTYVGVYLVFNRHVFSFFYSTQTTRLRT